MEMLVRDFKSEHQENSDLESGVRDSYSPERRSCRYYLVKGGISTFLGQTNLLPDQDIDDAFPSFHRAYFSETEYESLKNVIRSGAVLVAEADFSSEKSLLAFTLGNPDYWYGREATLRYFWIDFRPAN